MNVGFYFGWWIKLTCDNQGRIGHIRRGGIFSTGDFFPKAIEDTNTRHPPTIMTFFFGQHSPDLCRKFSEKLWKGAPIALYISYLVTFFLVLLIFGGSLNKNSTKIW
jgi:hypothetical protein